MKRCRDTNVVILIETSVSRLSDLNFKKCRFQWVIQSARLDPALHCSALARRAPVNRFRALGPARRLGGFVIHGNDAGTLDRCLESLRLACDEVVAVDSFSSDGSRDLVLSMGIRSVRFAWQGYGAARAEAIAALAGCDYVFFLDSDEYLLPVEIKRVRFWRAAEPRSPVYCVNLRNWGCLSGRRFLYRTERRARLVRYDAAQWNPEMIVHEALSYDRAIPTDITIEHKFASDIARRREKNGRYALLWALRSANIRRPKYPCLARAAHLLKDLVIKGALFRGGLDAIRLAWATSRYHSDKYRYLAEIEKGGYAELLADYHNRRYAQLFGKLAEATDAKFKRL